MDDRNRFVGRSALLMAVTAMFLVGLLSWQVRRDASRAADRTLATLATTQKLIEAQENRNLTMRGELIAGNQAVVAYMTQALGSALPGTEIDRSSIIDLLEERRTQLGLSLAAVVSLDGSVLASADPDVRAQDFATEPVFQKARKTQAPAAGLWANGGTLLQVAMLPLARYGSGDAYLMVGQVIGEEFAQAIAGAAAADVAIITPSPAGPVVVASTLDAAAAESLAQAMAAQAIDDGSRRGLELSSRHAESQSAPLFGNPDVRVVALAPDLPVSTITATHLPTVVFAIAVLLALAATLAWYWRQIATPLLELERLMGRSADTGDRHLSLAERGAPRIRRVAESFNRLMGARNGGRD